MKRLALFLLLPAMVGCGIDPYPSCKALANGRFTYAGDRNVQRAHRVTIEDGRIIVGKEIPGSIDLSVAYMMVDGQMTACRLGYDIR